MDEQIRRYTGEGQERWPDGLENEWKSGTDGHEEVEGMTKIREVPKNQ